MILEVAILNIREGAADAFESAFREGATIAVVASLYGMPIGWNDVRSAAAAHGVLVIEDAAQGHGASWQGQPLGSLGDLSVLSFSRGKGWTGGYGGALLSRGALSVPDIAAAGASSRTACALVPPMPNELTPARRGRSAPFAQGVNAAFTKNGVDPKLIFGLGDW